MAGPIPPIGRTLDAFGRTGARQGFDADDPRLAESQPGRPRKGSWRRISPSSSSRSLPVGDAAAGRRRRARRRADADGEHRRRSAQCMCWARRSSSTRRRPMAMRCGVCSSRRTRAARSAGRSVPTSISASAQGRELGRRNEIAGRIFTFCFPGLSRAMSRRKTTGRRTRHCSTKRSPKRVRWRRSFRRRRSKKAKASGRAGISGLKTGATDEKLRRGLLEPDARLDLHGFTDATRITRCSAFCAPRRCGAQARARRHGKGRARCGGRAVRHGVELSLARHPQGGRAALAARTGVRRTRRRHAPRRTTGMAAKARSTSICARSVGRVYSATTDSENERKPLDQSGLRRQRFQRSFRPRAVMRNHFGGAQRGELAAMGEAAATRQRIKESGRELIARAGGVDDALRPARRRRHALLRPARSRSPFPNASAPRCRARLRARCLQHGVEVFDFEQRFGFVFIGEDDVEIVWSSLRNSSR